MVDQSQRRKTAVTAIGGYVLNPKKHNLSFGRWAMPVMAKKMQSPEINERRRAVQSLCDFVFDSRRVASKEFTSEYENQSLHVYSFIDHRAFVTSFERMV
ncbi:hypothetical protein AVEN_69667-1 [Araneus ventricosus]|uniref:Uncharacterized protein n=1 Tax=Araneus ventricosus TaxID=182803 RepID=A0A4Y2HUS2_ARAVE|nr:hypothetical protein AVEN_69667-1 [Araneus ventricosus]